MDLIPWHPLRELERVRSPLERFFADPVFGTGMTFGGAINAFPVEVVEEGSDIVVRCELAGLNPEDVDVRITDQGVTIRGERRAQETDRQRGMYRSERFYGAFSRAVASPFRWTASRRPRRSARPAGGEGAEAKPGRWTGRAAAQHHAAALKQGAVSSPNLFMCNHPPAPHLPPQASDH